jgi:hypothetical protein
MVSALNFNDLRYQCDNSGEGRNNRFPTLTQSFSPCRSLTVIGVPGLAVGMCSLPTWITRELKHNVMMAARSGLPGFVWILRPAWSRQPTKIDEIDGPNQILARPKLADPS